MALEGTIRLMKFKEKPEKHFRCLVNESYVCDLLVSYFVEGIQNKDQTS